jgi:Uma2 family endonuclease
MVQTKKRPATYADIEALPAHMTGEIAFGVLHTMGRPRPEHGHAAFELQAELRDPFRRGRGGPGGWLFLPEPELRLGAEILVPDIAGWRTSTMTVPPKGKAWIETPPDWLCEILSPSTRAFDRTDKLSIYASFGVSHCWLIDPDAQTLEVFALTNRQWLLVATYKDRDTVNAPPFEAHAFSLAMLWLDAAGDND